MTMQTTFRWNNLTESTWVDAVYQVLQNAPPPLDNEIDVRNWVFPDAMPTDRIRLLLDFLRVPDTTRISDEFTRRVGNNLFQYFQRNTWLALNRTAQDLQFNYTYTWRFGDRNDSRVHSTRRTGIDFVISPSPQIFPDERYVQLIGEWLRWIWPYLQGEVYPDDDPDEGLRPRIKVELANFSDLNINVRAGVNSAVAIHRQARVM